MKLTCADCGFESDEAIVRDGLGWKGICPKCGQSFDVAIRRCSIAKRTRSVC